MSNQFKPDWKDAPEWARYLAQDKDGLWYWFQRQPIKQDVSWQADDNSRGEAADVTGWHDSLESRPKDYALYKGEELLAVGTIAEIAEQMGVNVKSIAYYLTESYQKRLAGRKRSKNIRTLEPIDDEDEDEEDDLID